LRLAIFDLDGTLTRRDSFGPFVCGLLVRHPLRWWRLLLLVVPAVAYLLGRSDRGRLKGAIVHGLFAGLARGVIDARAQAYARKVVALGMFPAALQALRAHQAANDYTVLLSASPDLYVPHIAHELGAREVHCTQLLWNDDRLDGRLAGPNRRGPEKVQVLQQLRAAHPDIPVVAYGNSRADLAHMVLCEEAVFVNAPASLRRAGDLPGMRWEYWR
jgi:HAD superfamily hydrolase (TIGR01490 family)